MRQALASLSRIQAAGDFTRVSVEEEEFLAKALLHECAHGILHIQEFWNRTQANPGKRVKLDPKHEQDAWLYANVAWGILVGDHSRETRVAPRGGDLAWMLT